jgi:hypothetical protein
MTMLCFNKQLLYDSRFLMFQILSCKMNEFGLKKKPNDPKVYRAGTDCRYENRGANRTLIWNTSEPA